jgi:hypothetical protein
MPVCTPVTCNVGHGAEGVKGLSPAQGTRNAVHTCTYTTKCGTPAQGTQVLHPAQGGYKQLCMAKARSVASKLQHRRLLQKQCQP